MSQNQRKVVDVTSSHISCSVPNSPTTNSKEFLQKTPIVRMNSPNWKVGVPNPIN